VSRSAAFRVYSVGSHYFRPALVSTIDEVGRASDTPSVEKRLDLDMLPRVYVSRRWIAVASEEDMEEWKISISGIRQ